MVDLKALVLELEGIVSVIRSQFFHLIGLLRISLVKQESSFIMEPEKTSGSGSITVGPTI